MKRLATLFLLLLIVATLYFSFWPTGFDAQNWSPPTAPELKAERLLAGVTILTDVEGPEDVEITDSHIVAALLDGRVVRISRAAPYAIETLFNTGGRPLGIDQGKDGTWYITDAKQGLLQWKDGQLTTLLPASDHYQFIDDVVIANGSSKIYFSNASTRWGIGYADADILEHQKTGTIEEYDLATKSTRVIADNLSFANGVTLSPDEATLYFTETGEYRVWAYDIAKGELKPLAENLPGMPDNISTTSDGLWVALFTPRNDILDSLAEKAWLRNAIFRLPKSLMPKPVHHALALKLDFKGKVVRVLEDSSTSAYAPVTSVQQVGDELYLGSLYATGVAHLPSLKR